MAGAAGLRLLLKRYRRGQVSPWLGTFGAAPCFGMLHILRAASSFAPCPLSATPGHPHGLLGNAYFLAFCTNQLGFEQKFPGIRLSIGAGSCCLCCCPCGCCCPACLRRGARQRLLCACRFASLRNRALPYHG